MTTMEESSHLFRGWHMGVAMPQFGGRSIPERTVQDHEERKRVLQVSNR